MRLLAHGCGDALSGLANPINCRADIGNGHHGNFRRLLDRTYLRSDSACGVSRLGRERLNFSRENGETFSGLASTGGLNGGVQSQQVSPRSDI